MNNWVKLTNYSFDDFNIEEFEGNFFIPEIYVSNFKCYIEKKAKGLEDKKFRMANLLNSPTDSTSNIGQLANQIVTDNCMPIDNLFYCEIDSKGDNELLTGVDDKERLLEVVKKQFGEIYDEYLIVYQKQNLFGEFKGIIITNKRLLSIGSNNFSLKISDIESLGSGFLGFLINNKYKIRINDKIQEIIKNLIATRNISFAFIIKYGNDEDFFYNSKGLLYISRDSIE